MNKKTIFGFFAVGFLSIACVSVVLWQVELRHTTTETRVQETKLGIVSPVISAPNSLSEQSISISSFQLAHEFHLMDFDTY